MPSRSPPSRRSSESHPKAAIPVPTFRHSLRQLKFVVPGGVLTYYLRTSSHLYDVLERDGLARTSTLAFLSLGAVTISLFLYVLLMPFIKGSEPDFKGWRQSGTLSRVIPVLTASIVSGWTLLVFILARWTELGLGKGLLGAGGLYALTFGLMGLIPAPKIRR